MKDCMETSLTANAALHQTTVDEMRTRKTFLAENAVPAPKKVAGLYKRIGGKQSYVVCLDGVGRGSVTERKSFIGMK